MKNKFILISALALSLILTGCSGGNTGETAPAAENAVDTIANTIADTAAESAADLSESAAADTEETEATEETEEETTEAIGEETENNDYNFGNAEKYYNGVFHGSGYTLEIDGDTWTDFTGLIDIIFQIASKSDNDMDITDTSGLFEGMFYCNSSSNGTNIAMSVMAQDTDGNISAENFGDITGQYYQTYKNYEMLSCTDETVNGYNCVRVLMKATENNITAQMEMNCFWENRRQVAICFTASESEFDEYYAEFEKILNTISFEDQ